MDAETKNRVQAKIFVGFELKADINLALNINPLWKQAKVSNTTSLIKARYQDKNYIGQFLSHELITVASLQEIAKEVRISLQQYCLKIDLSPLKIHVFPQVFIT